MKYKVQHALNNLAAATFISDEKSTVVKFFDVGGLADIDSHVATVSFNNDEVIYKVIGSGNYFVALTSLNRIILLNLLPRDNKLDVDPSSPTFGKYVDIFEGGETSVEDRNGAKIIGSWAMSELSDGVEEISEFLKTGEDEVTMLVRKTNHDRLAFVINTKLQKLYSKIEKHDKKLNHPTYHREILLNSEEGPWILAIARDEIEEGPVDILTGIGKHGKFHIGSYFCEKTGTSDDGRPSVSFGCAESAALSPSGLNLVVAVEDNSCIGTGALESVPMTSFICYTKKPDGSKMLRSLGNIGMENLVGLDFLNENIVYGVGYNKTTMKDHWTVDVMVWNTHSTTHISNIHSYVDREDGVQITKLLGKTPYADGFFLNFEAESGAESGDVFAREYLKHGFIFFSLEKLLKSFEEKYPEVE